MKYLNMFLYVSRYILAYPVFVIFYEFNKKINLLHLTETSKEMFLMLSLIMTFAQIIKFLIVKTSINKIYDDELAKFIKFEDINKTGNT